MADRLTPAVARERLRAPDEALRSLNAHQGGCRAWKCTECRRLGLVLGAAIKAAPDLARVLEAWEAEVAAQAAPSFPATVIDAAREIATLDGITEVFGGARRRDRINALAVDLARAILATVPGDKGDAT